MWDEGGDWPWEHQLRNYFTGLCRGKRTKATAVEKGKGGPLSAQPWGTRGRGRDTRAPWHWLPKADIRRCVEGGVS